MRDWEDAPRLRGSACDRFAVWDDGSVEQAPIERAVLDGLEEVRRLYPIAGGQVGDGPGDLEDAVVGAGGEAEALHGLLEQISELRVERAVFAYLPVAHAGVGEDRFKPMGSGRFLLENGLETTRLAGMG